MSLNFADPSSRKSWRKCVGIEPTDPAARDPQDLKSRTDTSPHALPPLSLPQPETSGKRLSPFSSEAIRCQLPHATPDRLRGAEIRRSPGPRTLELTAGLPHNQPLAHAILREGAAPRRGVDSACLRL